MPTLRVALPLLACAWASGPAGASPIDEIGGYELEAVDQVMQERGLELEPAPHGKIVGRIHVANLDVFRPIDGGWQLFNVFHATTRDAVVRREVLLRPGDRWDQKLADETARRLRDPVLTSLALVLPVRSHDPLLVDLLVITWDVWSLRLNSDFEYQEGTFSTLYLRPAENNFLGLRKQVGGLLDMDLGSYAVGPVYFDPNLLGTHVVVDGQFLLGFDRATSEFEGTRASLAVALPLWALDRRWGWSVRAVRESTVERQFEGTEVARYDAPSTPAVEEIPHEFRQRLVTVTSEVLRRTPDRGGYKHDVALGHELTSIEAEVLASFPDDPAALADFTRDEMPQPERTSAAFVRYRLFRPAFAVLYDVRTYDLAEDLQVGPDVTVEVATGATFIGSDRGFLRARVAPGWAHHFGDGAYVRALASGSLRFVSEGTVDEDASLSLDGATRPLWPGFRAIARVSGRVIRNSTRNEVLEVGGDTGLRGYTIGAFKGDSLVVANFELRTMHLKWSFTRLGCMLFWDVGHAADGLSRLSLHHDVGLGLRVVVPQSGPDVLRIDWAVPLSGDQSGLERSRVTLGFGEVF